MVFGFAFVFLSSCIGLCDFVCLTACYVDLTMFSFCCCYFGLDVGGISCIFIALMILIADFVLVFWQRYFACVVLWCFAVVAGYAWF